MRVKSVKNFKQYDNRWGKLSYPSGPWNMTNAGCGPTSLADLIASNPKHKKVTPKTLRKWLLDHGYVSYGNGTYWNGITAALKAYGFTVKECNISDFFAECKKGHCLADFLFVGGSRGGVTWTSGGHYVSVSGYKVKNGKHYLYMNDPGPRKHNGWYCYETTMKGLIRKIWACHLPEEKKKVTSSYLDKVTENAKKVYKAAIGCKHVCGTKATTFAKMKQMKELSCNRTVSIVLQLSGYLKTGKIIGHTKAAKGKKTIDDALKNKKLLENCEVVWVNKKYANLPKEYKVGGVVYIYNSNAAMSAGDGWIWSCNAGRGYDKKAQKYTKYKNGILSKGKGYSFTNPILVVIKPKDTAKKTAIKTTTKTTTKTITTKTVKYSYPTLPSRGYFQTGDRGSSVKKLQTLLNKLKYNCGVADGIYGLKTVDGVKAFQKAIKLTVDGKFGAKSLTALKKKLG